MASDRIVFLDGQPRQYKLRRSRRAKNIILHVEVDGSIEVVVPWYAAYREAERFVMEKEEWLRRMLKKNKALQQAVPKRNLTSGASLPYFGQEYRLRLDLQSTRKRKRVSDDGVTVAVLANQQSVVRTLLERWYRQRSRDWFVGEAIRLAATINARVTSVKILNTKSQWGSCNRTKGALTFQWRLALGPPQVARYVVAHEVAHLKHSKHSPAYWGVVTRLEPEYEQHRKWLRLYGYTLML